MNPVEILGIDLGTTNSVIAVWEPEANCSRVLSNREGERLTPSVVAFDPGSGGALVGAPAVERFAESPGEVVYSVKRFIGRTAEDKWVRHDQSHISFPIEETAGHNILIRLGERSLTPTDVSAEILRKLKCDGETVLGQPIKQAVITVPAYFNEAQRQATKEAGEKAGLIVPRIINEPTAAALAFGLGDLSKKAQTVAIFDLGGGTFDLSILRIDAGMFRVKATDGDTHLGGDDFDQVIVQWLWEQIRQEADHRCRPLPPMAEDAALRVQLRAQAEAAKVALSTVTECAIAIPSQIGLGEPHCETILTRATLEHLVAPLINRTLEICARLLEKARMKAKDIDQVLLIGGQTRMPAVRNALRERFGWTLNDSVNPDEAVAQGAAILGGRLSGYLQDRIRLWDVVPMSLGIELADGRMERIIKANEQIPVTVRRDSFTTQRDGQERICFRVCQGEQPMAADNVPLGEVILNLSIARPAGVPRINCLFKIDHDGILHVRAEDAETEGNPVEVSLGHFYKSDRLEVDERKE
jgi:molecular chaperone DnaK